MSTLINLASKQKQNMYQCRLSIFDEKIYYECDNLFEEEIFFYKTQFIYFNHLFEFLAKNLLSESYFKRKKNMSVHLQCSFIIYFSI